MNDEFTLPEMEELIAKTIEHQLETSFTPGLPGDPRSIMYTILNKIALPHLEIKPVKNVNGLNYYSRADMIRLLNHLPEIRKRYQEKRNANFVKIPDEEAVGRILKLNIFRE